MKRIHKQSPRKRIAIGQPFELIVKELTQATNTENLSSSWSDTDTVRYALSELWKRTGKPLPKECADMLKMYNADFDA